MLLSGKFELYKVSFPIKAMSPVSILKLLSTCSIHTPIYFNAAAFSQDPVQRMKLVITQSLSFIYPTHCFDKPLNPILGETYQAVQEDGSEICLEQVCHHPPISYICQYGPKNSYRWYGYTTIKPKASLNSISLNVEGSKIVEFQDGSKIWYTPTQDIFQNTLFGTLVHQLVGRCDFKDDKNGITAYYYLGQGGPTKKSPKDYLIGEISKDGKVISQIKGNYMGWLEFDGIRYFDVRDMQNFKPSPLSESITCSEVKGSLRKKLKSDATERLDCISFIDGDIEKA